MVTFIKSCKHAVQGLRQTFKGRNFKIQVICGALAVIGGLIFKISYEEWLVIILLIFVVLSTETLNTAIEEACNQIKDLPGMTPLATKKARDIAAAAALIISFAALFLGLVIFIPKIIKFLV